MAYKNDKEVVFAFMRRIDYNQTWEEIARGIDYDLGDFNFGKGDSKELRDKIVQSVKFLKIQFDNTFDDKGNTK